MEGEGGTDGMDGQIFDAVRQRSAWENRQTRWYELRHGTLKRKGKPFKDASDRTWPLVDTQIDRLKPMFMQQAVGMDVVASFVPMRQQLAAYTSVAEAWFNYKVRERTNFQTEVLSWVDYALMSGRGVMKVVWNDGDKRVEYEAVDPLYFIVPATTTGLDDVDWCVHVMPMSIAAYKRMAVAMGWRHDKATIEKIQGNPQSQMVPNTTADTAARQLREGITYTTAKDQVIVWEVYKRNEDGGWTVERYSPSDPSLKLSDPMGLPYDHGMAPFIDFPYEIKDRGWYSPRGVCEILAPYQMSLTAMWNDKHDAMRFYNTPMFRAERELPNSINLRFQPGQILPFGVVPVAMAQPPVSFDVEMNQTRAIAEQRIGSPDYGMTSLAGAGSDRRTATEIQSINAQSMQSGDLRARLFRMSLGRLYKMTWSLLMQYDKGSLQYRFMEDSLMADPEALHDQYEMEPKGGLDMVSRQQMLQQAVNRKALFQNSPWIDQQELDKSILELDDPSLVKRLIVAPGAKQQSELEDEAKTIPTLLIGVPVPAKAGQDYAGRIGVLMQWLNGAMQAGMQLSPQAQQAYMQRIDSLLQAYEQVATNEARKLRKEIQTYLVSIGLLPDPKAQPLPAVPTQQEVMA